MGESGGFDGEIELPGGSFSRLLLSPDDVADRSFCMNSPAHTPLFSSNTPKMLCFGNFGSETTPKSTLTHSGSSSASSCANTNLNTSNSIKKRNGSGQESGQGSGNNGQKNGKKKNKAEVGPTSSTSPGHAKGRREKLGERITALQQLVSPYGKTDTASVLHEAMGYIRFLHEQVKVLSCSYLERLPSSSSSPHHSLSVTEKDGRVTEEESTKGLRSRGLCLVPVGCIVDVANDNGADFWSSATCTSTP